MLISAYGEEDSARKELKKRGRGKWSDIDVKANT